MNGVSLLAWRHAVKAEKYIITPSDVGGPIRRAVARRQQQQQQHTVAAGGHPSIVAVQCIRYGSRNHATVTIDLFTSGSMHAEVVPCSRHPWVPSLVLIVELVFLS